MKSAQDYLDELASGHTRGGFNSRLQGLSLLESCDGTRGVIFGERSHGWYRADGMIKSGEIFSQIKDKNDIEFRCFSDGDTFFCIGPEFINLQESDNYTFNKTWQGAVDEFVKLNS